MGAKTFKAVPSLCLLALVAACGTGPGAAGGDRASTPDPATTPLPRRRPNGAHQGGVFFPRIKSGEGPTAVPEVMGGGKLVLDDRGCLRMTVPGGR